MISRKQLLENLSELGLENSIVDENASEDGSPAILLKRGSHYEWYTGRDIYCPGDDLDDTYREVYQRWLVDVFG